MGDIQKKILLYPLNNPFHPHSGTVEVGGWITDVHDNPPTSIVIYDNGCKTEYCPKFGLGNLGSSGVRFSFHIRIQPGLRRIKMFVQYADGRMSLLGKRWVRMGPAPVYNLRKPDLMGGASDYEKWIDSYESATYTAGSSDAIDQKSVVTFLIRTDSAHDFGQLMGTIDSLKFQNNPHWKCIIVDNGRVTSGLLNTATRREIQKDDRIRLYFHPKGSDGFVSTTEALNYAISKLTGGWVGFLEAGDLLKSDFVLALRLKLSEKPALKMVYTDNDFLGPENNRVFPQIKPEVNPDYLLSSNYIGPSYLFRVNVMEEIGGFDESTGGFLHWDFQLKLFENFTSEEVERIHGIYYHLSRNWKSDISGKFKSLFGEKRVEKLF